ncbi:hypothetical protein AALP_AA6G204400 [Arabis alpina]|uniref:Uncharacterized protein n=1 Tax=Arabis alpina TaxID=50452 RepID=A0A087GQJ6_ARAAL|nr:hypothetical protein AALP_AA6G204400 [Arabis alpina]
MRGVGGPLLSIGDLLADLGEDTVQSPANRPNPDPDALSQTLDLTRLFQENYDKLNTAFAASHHSWTSLTLELCTSLETANKLVHATTTNATLFSDKVEQLETIVKRGDSAVAAARTVHTPLKLLPSA